MEGDHSAGDGDAERSRPLRDYELEEVLFYLIARGLPEYVIFGYHDGWDFDRLHRTFLFMKHREIEEQDIMARCVAVGASAIMSKDVLPKFSKHIQSMREEIISKLSSEAEQDVKEQKSKRVMAGMSQLRDLISGPTTRVE